MFSLRSGRRSEAATLTINMKMIHAELRALCKSAPSWAVLGPLRKTVVRGHAHVVMIEFFQEALHRLHQRLRPRWAGEGGRPPPQQPEASGESSDDEYNLPLRPFNRYKGAMQDKRTLSGVVTVVNHENQFCLVNNEVIGTGR